MGRRDKGKKKAVAQVNRLSTSDCYLPLTIIYSSTRPAYAILPYPYAYAFFLGLRCVHHVREDSVARIQGSLRNDRLQP